MTALLLFFTLAFQSFGEIENPLVLPMGDRESLMGNSGISISGSAGNIFYNPAGLYSLTGKKFSASGTAYAYVKGRVEVFGDRVDFDSLVSVPNMIAITRRYRSWTYAFGIFSPIAFEGNVDADKTLDTGLRVSLSNNFRTEEQYIGVASGKDIGNGWSFGLGLFVHRYVNKTITSFFATPDPTAFYLSKTERTELEVLGLLPVIGTQVDVTEKLRFGMRIALPDIQLMGRSMVHSEQLAQAGGPVGVERIRNEANGHYRLPLDVGTGMSWTPNGKHSLTLDLGTQFSTKFDSMPGTEKGTIYKTETTFRQNLGYEYRFNDNYSMVAGLVRSPSAMGSSRDKDGNRIPPNNFFGGTVGAYFREKIVSSGIGAFYLNSRTSDVAFAWERDKKNGFSLIGVVLTTSIDY